MLGGLPTPAVHKGSAAGNTADEVRYWMFCQKRQKSECLPPTTESLRLDILRANYQSFIWKMALIANQTLPDPNVMGGTSKTKHSIPH